MNDAPTAKPGKSRGRKLAEALARLVLGIGLLVVVLRWLAPDWSELAASVELDPGWVLIGLLGTTLASFATAARWQLLAEAMGGTKLRFVSYFYGLVVTRFLGQFTSTMGMDLVGRGVAEGLAALPSLAPLLKFLAGTAAYWASNAVGTWLLARGCGLDVSFPAALAMMSVLGISLLIPGGPGQFGIFHYGMILGLSMFVTQLGMGVLLGVAAQRMLDLDWRATLTASAPTGTDAAPPPEADAAP